MKKILIATTALVATAGVAAAEVALSGDGRMGVVYNGDGLNDNNLNFASRARVKFTLSGETDGGLQFGGSFRADNALGEATTTTTTVVVNGVSTTTTSTTKVGAKFGTAGSVYISGAFGKLEMGDTLGAAEELIGDLPEVGFQDLGNNDIDYLTGDNSGNVRAALSNTGPNALYTYSADAFKVALSMNDGQSGNGATLGSDTQDFAIGAEYTMDAYSVALAYEVSKPNTGTSAKQLILAGEGSFGDTKVQGYFGKGSGAISNVKHFGLGVTSQFDAITVKGFVKRTQNGTAKTTYYGVGGEYSLGGGASVAFGLADNNAANTKVTADVGLKFTF